MHFVFKSADPEGVPRKRGRSTELSNLLGMVGGVGPKDVQIYLSYMMCGHLGMFGANPHLI